MWCFVYQDGFTVLHWAAISGGSKDSITRYLLKSDALITATDKVRLVIKSNISLLESICLKNRPFCSLISCIKCTCCLCELLCLDCFIPAHSQPAQWSWYYLKVHELCILVEQKFSGIPEIQGCHRVSYQQVLCVSYAGRG